MTPAISAQPTRTTEGPWRELEAAGPCLSSGLDPPSFGLRSNLGTRSPPRAMPMLLPGPMKLVLPETLLETPTSAFE